MINKLDIEAAKELYKGILSNEKKSSNKIKIRRT